MYTFSTLFDHNYLSRGLLLYESLKENCNNFHLYILATDDICYNFLKEKNFDFITVQSLKDIKEYYPILDKLQTERTITEFNWTLSSFSIQFFIKKFNLENCTYLDADTYFYNNPKLIYDELLPSESVLITPHNYASKYDQSNTSGRYCVQFMYFKNDENGNKVLEWWRNECEKFCNSSFKDGKFGDQKYLDDWLSRFPNVVHESKSLGIGVAPWNICRFNLFQKEDFFFIQDKITKLEYPVIFYHFHGLKEFYDKNNEKWWDYNFSYELSEDVQELFYEKYTKELTLKESICPSFTKRKLPKINYFYVIKISIKKSIKMFIKSLLVIKTFNQEKKSQIKHFVKD